MYLPEACFGVLTLQHTLRTLFTPLLSLLSTVNARKFRALFVYPQTPRQTQIRAVWHVCIR